MDKPSQVWKFDKYGKERPLQEQLDRLKENLRIINDHISWYSINPIRRNPVERAAAHQSRLKHRKSIEDQIKRLEKKIELC